MHFGLFSSGGSPAVPPGPEPPAPPAEARPGSFIGPGVRLAGALRSDQELTVQGRIEGPVTGGGLVVVDRGGVVEGDIRATVIQVRGRTQGTLLGSVRIHLEPGAEHHGAVRTPSLVVEAGAVVDGEVKVGKAEVEP